MKTSGFSLVELMVVVSILTILAIVAYPAYTSHMTKTRRTNAMGLLLQDAAFLERCYTFNGNYILNGNNSCNSLPFAQSPSSGTIYYNISIVVGNSGSTFTLTATPTGVQATDGNLTLDNNNVQMRGTTSGWN